MNTLKIYALMKKHKLIREPEKADDYLLQKLDREIELIEHGPLFAKKVTAQISDHDKELVDFIFSLIKEECYKESYTFEKITDCLMKFEEKI
ncbi:hypothetical protein [Acidianus bottle-shaped virus]|uniref:Uncharacterized protein ORF91b n=1 Tax=Acidianus bottle-shaped virus (isolate Italy/Pozzuoli) TaxID=654911 RepID=Y091B_ABVP|nr:hypothetical protein ABV_gp11 [Acidianus bottle-shaped virus]A4ZU97.1 RecName: Full=Uncharacterized protein ORF91b [Acidianus bottle-shaped virus (isolate Pozzuoli)]ABP73401.1 hypothetical protein [Acidianus bottle-shaped virus]